jgi:hypothetical protein
VVSNQKGEYSFETPAGQYELRAELEDFETAVQGPIILKDGESLKVDLQLRVKPFPPLLIEIR